MQGHAEGMGHNSAAFGEELREDTDEKIKQAGNWIAVSRDMRDHPVVGMGQPVSPADPDRGSYSRYEAWQDLLMEAKYRPFEIMNKGKVVTLERGQLMAARAWLARRWNWSEKTVRGFLARLETEFMVRSETGHRQGQQKGQQKQNTVNVITICNYDIYQTVIELMGLQKGQQNGHHEGQRRASEGPEYNKETINTDLERERESQDRVEVNGEAVYLHFGGKSKRIPFSTIDLWAINARMYDTDRARKIVQGIMAGWVADGKLPDKPALDLQRALKYGHIDDEVGHQRIANAKARGQPPVRKSNQRPRSWD